MPDYGIHIHLHGEDSRVVRIFTGTKPEAKKAAELVAVWAFPDHSKKWNNDALLLREGGDVRGCIAVEKWEGE